MVSDSSRDDVKTMSVSVVDLQIHSQAVHSNSGNTIICTSPLMAVWRGYISGRAYLKQMDNKAVKETGLLFPLEQSERFDAQVKIKK